MVIVTIFSRVVVEGGGIGWRHGSLLESWCVRRRLGAELSEVEIRTGAVPEIHRLVELPLRPVPVEDHTVERDDDDFDHNLDDCADQGPRLSFPLDVSPSSLGASNKILTCILQIRS